MRLALLVVIVLSFTSGLASTKDTTGYYLDDDLTMRRFDGRLIFGTNFTQVDGDTYAGYHKVGLNTGALVFVHFTQSFGISFELLYSQKGVRGGNVKESYAVGTYIDKYYLNLNYAEAALILHYTMGKVMDYEAGISYDKLIASKEWAEADVPIYIPPSLAYFNNYDLEYIIGLTLRFRKHWFVNARYQYSLTSIRPRDRVYPRYSDGSSQQYNEVVSLRLMYSL